MPMPAFAQQISDRNLSDLRVDNVGGCSTLTINFNIRVQLISHFPENTGRELHIRVQPIDAGGAPGRESLRVPESVTNLRSIEYDNSNPAAPVLSLYFNTDASFDVSAGDRPQSLIIHLSGAHGPCEAAANAVPATGHAGVVPNGHGLPAIPLPSGLYVLNLVSKSGNLDALNPAQAQALAGHILYENDFERDSQRWRRLRLGFFDTREQADAEIARLATVFPEAWALKVSTDERAEGVANRRDTGAGSPQAQSATPPSVKGSETDRIEADRLTTEAEAAIKAGQNDRAIQLLTNAAALPETAATPRTTELLALTYERKGQLAHAQAGYEDYLRRFPSGEAAERVRQRLAALTTVGGGSGAPQLRAAAGRNGAWAWGARGSFSQFYFRDQTTTKFLDASRQLPNPDVNNAVNLNQLLTSADVTITGGNDKRQLQIRAAGSFAKSFGTPFTSTTTNGSGGPVTSIGAGGGRDIKSLTALYADYSDRDLGLSMRLGRQTRNSDGVLGRFDGALVSYQVQPKLRVNVVAGFPVLNSHQMSVLDKRYFYGLSVDLGGRRSPLQSTLYWFDQRSAGGFVDRRSVGLEERLLLKNFNAFMILDYDIQFKSLNLGLLTLNYTFPDKSNLAVTADYRRSPLLTTNNALIGMIDINNNPVSDLRGLRPFFADPQIYDLAKGNSLITKSITATYSRPLSTKLQVNVDVTATDTGGTTGAAATSGTQMVFANPSIGREFYTGLQFIGSGLLWENDIYIFSGRYADTYSGRLYTADFNARIPLSQKLRISPRVRYGYRRDRLDQGHYSQLQPIMQLMWYPHRHAEFELEFGGNFTSQKQVINGALNTTTERGIVLTAGYRLDF